jgi:hypothetical protein
VARRVRFWPTVVCLFGVLGWAAISHRNPTAALAREADQASQRLAAFEALRRSVADFAELPTWDRLSGADPYLIARLPGSTNLVGVLRGADALVLMDEELAELRRIAAPRSPTALAVGDDGSVYVAGELSTRVGRFRVAHGTLVPTGSFGVAGLVAIRGLSAGPEGWLYLVEEHRGHLVGFKLPQGSDAPAPGLDAGEVELTPRFDVTVGNGPIRIERIGDRLVVDCLLDHALVIHKLEPSGALAPEPPIRIVHDGPIWSFAAKAAPGGMVLAAAGVEDHPLDRTIGAFGFVDSFLYVYQIDFARRKAVREGAINLSELGVVTPKAVAWASDSSDVVVSGYGADQLVRIAWSADPRDAPARVSAESIVPGTHAVIELPGGIFAFADPLLDAWVVKKPGLRPVLVPVRSTDEAPKRAGLLPLVRLGEGLFFTTAMAPWNSSDGPLSRFTCETCHYEGYVDGRIHHTGRGDVHAVTKPLLGLFNNRPHFSRALDDDLVTVAFNEFRVANARSGHDPWFALSAEQFPWLRSLGCPKEEFSPELLRKGLMTFLMSFSHRPNPMAYGRAHFSRSERSGAEVFRSRCESCHEARLVSDAPDSRAPFERWEEAVFSRQGPIVWGKAQYEKTGILPYVHELGARVPSLRRLYKKRPYFTNGSAKTVDAVLERACFGSEGFWHDPPKDGAASSCVHLGEQDRKDLLEFLDLL